MSLAFTITLCFLGVIPQDTQEETPTIARRVPPLGIELPAETQEVLDQKLELLELRSREIESDRQRADIEILTKAIRYALRYHEFYRPEDVDKAKELLKLAESRLQKAKSQGGRDLAARGLLVRGYRSSVDGSVQPYGLEIPEDLDLSKPVPLYVWLHGRGDRTTDLHFIHERLHRRGTVHPPNAIVLHPFGRQCIGFKSAGEIDVLESIDDVARDYSIDPQRIVLMGFSMGGAGVWHLAAHYPDRWVAASPGAGFAETAEYNHMQPADYPPAYTQKLWKVYDVPNYTLNLLNFPVVAYSGEKDKQIQAARVMERAFESEQQKLHHIIGPGMGHQYHPDSLQEILAILKQAADQGKPKKPRHFQIQTPTLRYSSAPGVQLLQLQQHWADSRLVGTWEDEHRVDISTKNVNAFRLTAPVGEKNVHVVVDGQAIEVASLDPQTDAAFVRRGDGTWHVAPWNTDSQPLRKQPGLQGPIDDVFLTPFLVVLPSAKGYHPAVDAWVKNEIDYFQSRWQYLFRGQLRIKTDDEVTAEDHQKYNLILWGDPQSNLCLRDLIDDLPLTWDAKQLKMGDHAVDATHHLPLLIYPNPNAPHNYVVLNSGPTFRDGHDRTNSLQNPKLPDWALLDIREPRSDLQAGAVVEAGFFDESWELPLPQSEKR